MASAWGAGKLPSRSCSHALGWHLSRGSCRAVGVGVGPLIGARTRLHRKSAGEHASPWITRQSVPEIATHLHLNTVRSRPNLKLNLGQWFPSLLLNRSRFPKIVSSFFYPSPGPRSRDWAFHVERVRPSDVRILAAVVAQIVQNTSTGSAKVSRYAARKNCYAHCSHHDRQPAAGLLRRWE